MKQRSPRSSSTLSLLAATGLLAIVFGLAVYAPLLSPHDQWYARSLVDGKTPPFPPGPVFPFGSDELGRDLLSWLMLGARSTIVVAVSAAALRVAIGGALALWLMSPQSARRLDRVAIGFASLPAMAIAVLAVIAANTYMGAVSWITALVLIGWASNYVQARQGVQAQARRDYVNAARALGVGRARLALRHVLPNVAPRLIAQFVTDSAWVIALMGELALLRVFLGGGIEDISPSNQLVLVASGPEWSAMLAGTRPITSIANAPWTIIGPGLALFATAFAIALAGDTFSRFASDFDVFALFSRRRVTVATGILIVLVLPLVLWPDALTPARAAGAYATGPRAEARMATLNAATTADQAFANLQSQLTSSGYTVQMARLSVTTMVLRGSALEAYTVAGAGPGQGAGRLAYVKEGDPGHFSHPDRIRGTVVLAQVTPIPGSAPPFRLSAVVRAAANAGAVAVIAWTDVPLAIWRASERPAPPGTKGIPVLLASTDQLQSVLGLQGLAELEVPANDAVDLKSSFSFSVAEQSAQPQLAHALIASSAGGGFAVAASVGGFGAVIPGWGADGRASVAAALLTADGLRAAGVAHQLVFYDGDGAALASVQGSPPPTGAISVGEASQGDPQLQVEFSGQIDSPQLTRADVRVARRIGDGLGLRVLSAPLSVVGARLRAAGMRGPVIGVSADRNADALAEADDAATIAGVARAALTLIAYLQEHPAELLEQ